MEEKESEYILSISYGKDSLACLGAIEKLGLPLDRIVHAEVWATDGIPADLPPMVKFKEKADKIIKERWGIEVEHFYAEKDGEKWTYEKSFYQVPKRRATNKNFKQGDIVGFPVPRMPWCNSELKRRALTKIKENVGGQSDNKEIYEYLGIAADETKRIERQLSQKNKILPLVNIGWTEADCYKWCEENNLLSPLYQKTSRGGCWFCHNQRIEQLRQLWKDYPDLWNLLLKWDLDSPTTFHPDGHTIHDFDKRFELEEKGIIDINKKFRWKDIIKIVEESQDS